MSQATTVGPILVGEDVQFALRVSDEPGAPGDVEYTVSVPLAALAGMSEDDQRAYLIEAAVAERSRHHPSGDDPGLPSMPETVEL